MLQPVIMTDHLHPPVEFALNPPTGLSDGDSGVGVGLVGAGLVRVCGLARFGACGTGVRGCGGLVAGGVGLRCAGRGGRVR